ncbi:MAG: molybdate ABC transporter substrate-binding protein [Chloroflexi bacterium]|nr:molybdate ABC transporter substrate-binding protein [Chloroflexota bacterium]
MLPHCAALLALVGSAACGGGQPTELLVSAAADLTPAFQEIGQQFEQETGIKVTFNFGSTGQLSQQIQAGAPVDVFAAANVSYIEDLERRGLIVPGTRALYARGRLILWTRADSALSITGIADLAQPDFRRIALANPEHAPYGIAARQALQSVGLWDTVQPKLVLAENVRQALQYAETGNADMAMVALSLALQGQGRYILVPQELYAPLDQALGVIVGTKHEAEARRFAVYVNSPTGRVIMRKYGFMLPGE